MAKPQHEVDRQKLEEAVRLAEQDGPVEGGILGLNKRVADIYNEMDGIPRPITFSVAGLRIQSWGLELKTSKSRNRTPKARTETIPPVQAPERAIPKPVSANAISYSGGRKVHTPAGDPPAKLRYDTDDQIRDWVKACQSFARNENPPYWFCPEALNYWVSRDLPKDDAIRVKMVINAMFDETEREDEE